MKNYIVLENIRSSYNVGNVIRTADALGFNIIISGFTPSPFTEEKVKKTSLGAENNIQIIEFRDCMQTISYLKSNNIKLFGAEITQNSIGLDQIGAHFNLSQNIAIFFGNETNGVLPQTLQHLDGIFHIPMNGIKESLNVGQSAAIFMREIYRIINNNLIKPAKL